MDKTTHPLLVPRWKVIADYPGCPYEIDTILIADAFGELYSEIAGYAQSAVKIMDKETGRFSHLIQKLKWWEQRQESELPEYVYVNNVYYKVDKWIENLEWLPICVADADKDRKENFLRIDWYFQKEQSRPVTLEEYNAYLKLNKTT